MQKNFFLSSIAIITLFSLVGCGGSSSETSINTGIGYYVDSALKGVTYICGSKTGKTDIDGQFTFEKGQECNFSLAGILLRRTKVDELVDGKKVVEDNPKVARLLQSIDSDNNLTNGIQITDEVLTALTKALETSNSVGKLPKDEVTLTEVVASIGDEVIGVNGNIRTDAQVQEHLNQTQTDITKELLSGKTFFVVGEDGENNQIILSKIVLNKEVTLFKSYKLDGTLASESKIEINGNKMIFTPSEIDGYFVIFSIPDILISQENGYVFADDRLSSDGIKYGIGHRYYALQSDAQAYYNSIKNR